MVQDWLLTGNVNVTELSGSGSVYGGWSPDILIFYLLIGSCCVASNSVTHLCNFHLRINVVEHIYWHFTVIYEYCYIPLCNDMFGFMYFVWKYIKLTK